MHEAPGPQGLHLQGKFDDIGAVRPDFRHFSGRVGGNTAPVVLADAGVENVNAQVDELIHTGVLRRLLAFTALKFSNSVIEA